MKTGIIICPPLLYPGKLVIVLFIYSYDGKPTICHTSPGRNGVPMIYREKACILPPVYYSAPLHCCPYSFLIIPRFKTFYRLILYSCEPVIKYGNIIFQGIQSICIIKVHTSQYYVICYKSISKYIG